MVVHGVVIENQEITGYIKYGKQRLIAIRFIEVDFQFQESCINKGE